MTEERWRPMEDLPRDGREVWALTEGGAIDCVRATEDLEARLYLCGWRELDAGATDG
jgi:hypothetical protein